VVECLPRLASAILDIGDNVEDCIIVSSVLWLLLLYEKVIKVIDDCERTVSGSMVPSLSLLRAAAMIRREKIPDIIGKQELIDRLAAMQSQLSEAARSGYPLGFGYVTFHAWLSETGGELGPRSAPKGSPEILNRWVEQSFNSVDDALPLFKRDSLPWAFAVNHCAYVGSVVGIEPERTLECLRWLEYISGKHTLWNYRFADTLACHHIIIAEQNWMDAERRISKNDKEDYEKARLQACGRLNTARQFLDDAPPDFNGPEIREHKTRLNNLWHDIGCIDSEIPR
jgi:hypothetical protein